MDFSQTFICDVGIDLSSRDIGMTEHYLDTPKVGSVFEEVCGETVANDVRGNFF